MANRIPRAHLDAFGLVNPQISTSCVEASAPKVIGSLLCAPASQAYHEQTVAHLTTK